MSTPTPFGPYSRPAPGTADERPTIPSPDLFVIPSRQPTHPVPKHILIVDADPIVCAQIGGRLNRTGYSVALACTRPMADALRIAVPFDLIICELQPMDEAALAWVKRLVDASPAPVILTAADHAAESTIHLLPLAVAAFFAKPIDHVALGRVVEQLLSGPDA